ncbi:RidA family protein [Hydrogenophaga sp. BPS33]|uniref:RidA family protein n=1 Tax=Hydrogenophaga sp. BPS33 TaxID=2651974 RepID=UPI00131FED26|nr:RidA family protein [Hydrogenophaga sp. BPS33]QHE87334.1 RidA family protein [Hydrogenophaga sp. BPS33]
MSSSQHPYSLAFEKDGVVYISGATSIDYATHQPVEGDAQAVDAALDEVERRLRSVGLELRHIVKATYFLVDLGLREHANRQFETRFQDPRPARTVVGVAANPYGGKCVIDVIAHR